MTKLRQQWRKFVYDHVHMCIPFQCLFYDQSQVFSFFTCVSFVSLIIRCGWMLVLFVLFLNRMYTVFSSLMTSLFEFNHSLYFCISLLTISSRVLILSALYIMTVSSANMKTSPSKPDLTIFSTYIR